MNDPDQLLELTARYMEGATSVEETRALQEMLRSDAALRRRFLSYMNIDSVLGGMVVARHEAVASPLSRSPGKRTRTWRRTAGVLGLAALVVVCAGVWRAWPGRGAGSESPAVVAAPRSASVALVTATHHALWTDPNVELALNSGEMPAGMLRLAAGRVEFLLPDGATMVVQGPAAFRFADRKRIDLAEGRVICSCPTPESRLTVVTPQTEVVDLGTVFSVETRDDQSTHVAVLSGEVEVRGAQSQRLRQGEAAEVRTSRVTRLEPLSAAECERLEKAMRIEFKADSNTPNQLSDAGFEQDGPLWHGTDPCLERMPTGGRSGGAMRIRAQNHPFWPLAKQDVRTGDISGQLVSASVWACTPGSDRLRERQHAVLKLAFVDAEGREFACATRHFLKADSPSDEFVQAVVAAKAPAGTHGVQVQLILNAARLKSGSVIFDDVSMVTGDWALPLKNP